MPLSFARLPSRMLTVLGAVITLLAGTLGNAWAQVTIDVGASSNALTTTQATATFPVTITRAVATPVLGYSVVFTHSGQLSLPAGTGSITTGTFLTATGATATLQVRDLGGGQYAADGVTLGLPCGSSALTGTLFTIAVSSSAPGGTGTITINSVSLRDCSNQPLASVIGTAGSVSIDNTLPVVAVTSPDGGESWDAGSAHDITWTATDGAGFGPAAVDLEWSSSNGGAWSAVATGIANSGTFSWTVPDVATPAAIVRVTARDLNGNSATDVSNAVFTVRGTSSTSLASSPDPSVVGQSVTLTATVAPGAATGTVDFFEGVTLLGSSSLTLGSASISISSLALGAHTLHAVYAGDASYIGSTSATDAHTVNPSTTTTSLSSSPNPTVVGQSASLTVTVSAVAPGSGTPTGSVDVFEGLTSLGSAALSGGTATFPVSTLGVGSHVLHAVYAGTPSFTGSTSADHTHNVSQAATTTTLLTSPAASVVGQGVTLTASIAVTAPGAGAPTGSVEFFDGATSLGTQPVVAGSASLGTSALAVGTRSLTAVYLGDVSFSTSTSSAHLHTVSPAATTTSLSSAPNPSTFGESVLLSASVAAVAPGTGTPAGNVQFLDGVTVIGTQPLAAGSASISVSTLSAGTHALTAVYVDSPSFTTSTSAIVSQVVNAATTTVSLTTAPDPGVYLDSETLTATVAPAAATGDVEFFDGITSLGTATLSGGIATRLTSGLAVGPHSLTAQYLGDVNHTPATSAAVLLEVKAKIVATAGANGSIAPSGTVLVSLNATPAFTFTPDPGFHVSAVTVDGGAAALTSPYTFAAVSSNHTIDVQFAANPAVPAISTLASTTMRTGNGAGGIERIRLTWSGVAPGSTVQVYRAPYGNYPEYDDGPSPGSVPAVPAYPPTAPWVLTTVTASGTDDFPPARDFYYYVAFVTDGFGTVSPVSNRTTGSLAYALGDVSDQLVAGQGDNLVAVADLSLLGSIYGRALTPGDVYNYVDIGPTTNFSVHARPTTDNLINFEDLVLFGLNFDQVSAPAASATPSPAKRDELRLDAPAEVTANSTVTARLLLSGTGAIHAISTTLAWDPEVLEPAGYEISPFLAAQRGVALSPLPGMVDMAVLGSEVSGMSGSGEVATLTFRARRSGSPGLRLAHVDARDGLNHRITLATGIGAPSAPVFKTGLALARPTPFRDRTEVLFTLNAPASVQLAVHAVDGRRIRTLASGMQASGEHRLEWDGRDDGGRLAPAGVYYVRFISPQAKFTRKLTFLR